MSTHNGSGPVTRRRRRAAVVPVIERGGFGNGHDSLHTLREAEKTIDELRTQRERLLAAGRAAFGVVGRFEYGPLRQALRASDLHVAPSLTLGLAGGVVAAAIVFWFAAPSAIAATLGVGSLSMLPNVVLVVMLLAGVPMIALGERGVARPRLVAAGSGCGVLALTTAAFAGGTWALVAAAALTGAAGAAVYAFQWPLLIDHFRPEVRLRMSCVAAGVTTCCVAGALALLAVGIGGSRLSWRGALLVTAVVSIVAVVAAVRMADAPPGRWDLRRLRALVQAEAGGLGSSDVPAGGATAVPAAEKIRRVLAVRSAQPLFGLAAVGGFLLIPLPQFVPILLRDRFGVAQSTALALLALATLAGLPALAWLGRRGEVAFRSSPARLVRLGAWASTVAAVALAFTSVSPVTGIAVALLAVAAAGLAVAVPLVAVALLSAVPTPYRSHASLLLGVATFGGGLAGQQAMNTVGARFGVEWAFIFGGFVVLMLSGSLGRAAAVIEGDLDAVVGQAIDATDLEILRSRGAHVPLLSCHGLDFYYGRMQVLFGVDFTVDDGEMVALLGTNGAGKSTLLRAISGVGLPARGTVHFHGSDITYVASDKRVRFGISQVPGGRAVFGPLTIADNLRIFGYTHGRDRRAVERGIEAAFEAFPRLAERRNQLASTLSGGEQQMLGLSKALILRPQLLLIDELSLGLAPKVVGDLLEMVRRINAAGTAVVLVEQSVNVALSLVDHAYFLEKGEVRFDGSAAGLLERPDLLRSVFLEGAAKGFA